MPLEERLGPYNYERPAPIEESGERNHGEPKRWRRSAWLRIPFAKERELFAKKEISASKAGRVQKSNRMKVSNSQFYSTLEPLPWLLKDSDRIFAEAQRRSTVRCIS
jgi:hypothetical protein